MPRPRACGWCQSRHAIEPCVHFCYNFICVCVVLSLTAIGEGHLFSASVSSGSQQLRTTDNHMQLLSLIYVSVSGEQFFKRAERSVPGHASGISPFRGHNASSDKGAIQHVRSGCENVPAPPHPVWFYQCLPRQTKGGGRGEDRSKWQEAISPLRKRTLEGTTFAICRTSARGSRETRQRKRLKITVLAKTTRETTSDILPLGKSHLLSKDHPLPNST